MLKIRSAEYTPHLLYQFHAGLAFEFVQQGMGCYPVAKRSIVRRLEFHRREVIVPADKQQRSQQTGENPQLFLLIQFSKEPLQKQCNLSRQIQASAEYIGVSQPRPSAWV